MLIQPGETTFTAFMHPQGVEAFYAEGASSVPSRLSTDELRASVSDPRIFDEKAVDFAKEEGLTWGEFILRGLDVAGLRSQLTAEGHELRRRLGLGYTSVVKGSNVVPPTTALDSELQMGVAPMPPYMEPTPGRSRHF